MLKDKRLLLLQKRIFPILIICVCFVMGIGYATVNDILLNVQGEAVAKIDDNVSIISVDYIEDLNADIVSSNLDVSFKTVLSGDIVLDSSDKNSFLKYQVTVLNSSDCDYYFDGIKFVEDFYDNPEIIVSTDGSINSGDLLLAGESVSFNLLFSYDPNITEITNNFLNAYIHLDFVPKATLMNTYDGDTTSFRAVKNRVRNITFQEEINIPDDAINSWDIGLSQTGDIMAYVVESETINNAYDLYIQSDKQIHANEDMSYWFKGFLYVDSINGLELLDTTTVTDMSYMFFDTGSYSKEFELDVSSFNTSNVTKMNYMFFNAGYNSPKFTLNVDGFDTSNVVQMAGMFSGSGYSSTQFTLDLSSFDTKKVDNMAYMFYGTGYTNPDFTLDVSHFDTSKVRNMEGMFSMTAANATDFTLDISTFDISSVINMNWMFCSLAKHSQKLTILWGDFNTSNVKNMEGMFYDMAEDVQELNVNLSDLSFKNATNTSTMFFGLGRYNNNFDFTITIDGTSITSYTDMFAELAMTEGSKFTVNYLTDTEELVDQMLLTKTDGANVVKGANTEVITFEIEGVTYEALAGMTWEQWVNSEYNVDEYTIMYNHIGPSMSIVVGYESIAVSKDEEIVNNRAYITAMDSTFD